MGQQWSAPGDMNQTAEVLSTASGRFVCLSLCLSICVSVCLPAVLAAISRCLYSDVSVLCFHLVNWQIQSLELLLGNLQV